MLRPERLDSPRGKRRKRDFGSPAELVGFDTANGSRQTSAGSENLHELAGHRLIFALDDRAALPDLLEIDYAVSRGGMQRNQIGAQISPEIHFFR